jgi:hypothetical protein
VRNDGSCLLAPCSASMHAHARAIAATSGATLESLSTPAESSKRLVRYQNFRNCPYPSLPALVKKKKTLSSN